MAEAGKPTKQYDPDAQFFRAYLVGCGVILLSFLIGWALIAFFWLHR
jgi:hypothetical protein